MLLSNCAAYLLRMQYILRFNNLAKKEIFQTKFLKIELIKLLEIVVMMDIKEH